MKIPLFNLARQFQQNADLYTEAFQEVSSKANFIGGKIVENFENEFREYLGAKHFVSCANGTDALEIVYRSLGIGEGDEVIVPAMTWISSSESVVTVGAKPVFVDVNESCYTINVDLIESKLTKQTKAILAVHLYGQSAKLNQLKELCKKNNLYLIEDAAQAHGAEYHNQKLGAFGDAAIFSFFPSKNLGCFGDGGGMTFQNKSHADTAKMIANHGQVSRHRHIINGRNSRLDALQAKILSIKLPFLDESIRRKNEIATSYQNELQHLPIQLPTTESGNLHSWHLYVIKTKLRDELITHLNNKGVDAKIHYPKALPFQEVYSDQNNSEKEFKEALDIQNAAISLPIYAELSTEEQNYIIQTIKDFFQNG